ncbi:MULTISPECIES: hypothetical protein [unclassified Pseudonocardia]|uniref:hypothetical protein n=1 Tax=unclassified Pseudonocardia TaxID=2619320 RepID=UPI000AC31B83|nr:MULTISPECIES: hypothetical protein [unclassified Pseudonocardia]
MATGRRVHSACTFAAGFATCDVHAVADCISDDLAWELNGREATFDHAAFETVREGHSP